MLLALSHDPQVIYDIQLSGERTICLPSGSSSLAIDWIAAWREQENDSAFLHHPFKR
jgi:hypothetical protein